MSSYSAISFFINVAVYICFVWKQNPMVYKGYSVIHVCRTYWYSQFCILHVYVCVYVYVSLCVCVLWVSTRVCVYCECVHVCVYMSVYVCVCVYCECVCCVCVRACVRTCVCVTCMHTWWIPVYVWLDTCTQDIICRCQFKVAIAIHMNVCTGI